LRLLVEDLSDAANVPADDRRRAGDDRRPVEPPVSRSSNQDHLPLAAAGPREPPASVFDGPKEGRIPGQFGRAIRRAEPERVRRGSQFSQLTEEERLAIIERARRSPRGGCPAEVTKRLSRHSGRSIETIRYTLKQFDREQPRLAIFLTIRGPCGTTPTEDLPAVSPRSAGRFAGQAVLPHEDQHLPDHCRDAEPRGSWNLPLDYIPSETFPRVRTEKQEKEIAGPVRRPRSNSRRPAAQRAAAPTWQALYEVPLLTREQEVHLFRRMNFLKYKGNRLRDELDDCGRRAA